MIPAGSGRGLVDADWLASRLGDPSLVLLEIDYQPALYRRGHPPGARRLSWTGDLQHPLRRDIPDAQAMMQLWRRTGIQETSTVVFFGDLNNWMAAYGYWLFAAYGLPDVRLLDGGRQLWLAERRPMTRDAPAPPDHGPVPEPRFCPHLRADRADAARAARAGALADVRTPQEYSGQWLSEPEYPAETAQRAGHIPGAKSVPWDSVIALDGRIKPASELRRMYRAAGLAPESAVVTYCRIGERSAHTWVILHDILGFPDVRNYDGSWTEWGSITAMPIQTGTEAGQLPDDFQP
jgi:thiosulfate/3-mercaptopyruvate sulfurtransferase